MGTEGMALKYDWLTVAALAFVLVFVGSTIHAHVLSFVMTYFIEQFYIALAISALVPVVLIVFPGGILFFKDGHTKKGAIVGTLAALGIALLNALDGRVYPTTGFIVEYVSLIVFSTLAGYSARVYKHRHKRE